MHTEHRAAVGDGKHRGRKEEILSVWVGARPVRPEIGEGVTPVRSRAFRAGQVSPYLLLAPSVMYLVVMIAYPWLVTLFVSLHRWEPIRSPGITFVGLGNYQQILADPLFARVLSNTLYLTAVSVGAEFLLGLAIALLLNRDFPGKALVRTLVIVPMMMAPAIAALTWKLFVDVEYGLLNYLLSLVGVGKVLWTSSGSLSIPTVAIVEVWQNTPFAALVFLAGLQAIPEEQYEAAVVDGASWWQCFRFITVPWLRPMMLIVVLFRTIFIIRTFETVLLVLSSSGGPGNSAMVLGTYLFQYAFRFWNLGMGSAIAYAILLVTVVVVALQLVVSTTGKRAEGAI